MDWNAISFLILGATVCFWALFVLAVVIVVHKEEDRDLQIVNEMVSRYWDGTKTNEYLALKAVLKEMELHRASGQQRRLVEMRLRSCEYRAANCREVHLKSGRPVLLTPTLN